MAGKLGGSNSQGGQRNSISPASGRKERLATSTPHKGSRVEPSHANEKNSDNRKEVIEKKQAAKDKREGASKAEQKKRRNADS